MITALMHSVDNNVCPVADPNPLIVHHFPNASRQSSTMAYLSAWLRHRHASSSSDALALGFNGFGDANAVDEAITAATDAYFKMCIVSYAALALIEEPRGIDDFASGVSSTSDGEATAERCYLWLSVLIWALHSATDAAKFSRTATRFKNDGGDASATLQSGQTPRL